MKKIKIVSIISIVCWVLATIGFVMTSCFMILDDNRSAELSTLIFTVPLVTYVSIMMYREIFK